MKGLHPPQTAALAAKLTRPPTTSPIVKVKPKTLLAVSTSIRRFCRFGLWSKDAAQICNEALKYPFEKPNKNTKSMKMKSELMMGDRVAGETLHIKKRGTKIVRA